MNQAERRRFLIEALLEEESEYAGAAVPADPDDQRQMLRGLMNVRPPRAVPARFQAVQDEYLREETRRKGVVELSTLSPLAVENGVGLYVWQGDITTLQVDAIVNAANSGMTGCYVPNHRCIDNCIHTFAGVQLRQECARLMETQGYEEPTGQAKLTPGYDLPAKFILHTVGPIVSGPLTKQQCKLLASCYRSCLELAAEKKLESVAFCCISTGVFGFPNAEASQIAVETVREFLKKPTNIRQVVFNVFKDLDKELYTRQLSPSGAASKGA